MAISTYAELQTTVGNWLHRSDLASSIPDFITLAESKMNSDLNARSMDTRVTLTSTSAGTLDDRLVALPVDLLEVRRLMVVDSDPATLLTYKTPDELVGDAPYLLATDKPNSFTVVGDYIELSPNPDVAYPLELVYKQRVPALSDSNTTNWVLAQSPNVYLFGSLLMAAPFIQDDPRLPVWDKLYTAAVQSINAIDWYSGSTPRVRAK